MMEPLRGSKLKIILFPNIYGTAPRFKNGKYRFYLVMLESLSGSSSSNNHLTFPKFNFAVKCITYISNEVLF